MMGHFRQAGPLGTAGPQEEIDAGTLARTRMLPPGPLGAASSDRNPSAPALDNNTRQLAATAYGEGSVSDVFEEMAAIANVLVKQQKARGYADVASFIRVDKTFAYAAHDGSQRYALLCKASLEKINKSPGMSAALRAALNALSPDPVDYSNGAFFWDGADIKSKYKTHPKVNAGIHFTDPAHDIYDIKNKDVPGEEWWKDSQGRKSRLRGKWNYKYESTAAHGGTIFWKYNEDFLKATGNKEHN